MERGTITEPVPVAATGPLAKEAALIIGVVIAVLNGLATIIGLGAFDDGFQAADLIPILIPIAGALGIRQQVFSKETVAKIESQQRAGARR